MTDENETVGEEVVEAADVGELPPLEAEVAEEAPPPLKPGDCIDCNGPCQGHVRDFCDPRRKDIKCTHAPGSGECDHTKLHDDDEVSPQALEAARLGTRKYSAAWRKDT